MNLDGNSFGYDYFSPFEYYSLEPEDLNPSLKYNYARDFKNYYDEPPVHRRKHYKEKNIDSEIEISRRTLYILIIILVIVTVIQWLVIFSTPSSIVINNNVKEEAS